MTRIAEGLAEENQVNVICGMPPCKNVKQKTLRSETKNNVKIFRCFGAYFNDSKKLNKIGNGIITAIIISLKLLHKLRQKEIVLVVTSPPWLPFLIRLVCLFKKTKYLLLIHDVYPEALVAAKVLKKESLVVWLLDIITRNLFKTCDGIITLGRDMALLIQSKQKKLRTKNYIITNWADTDLVIPGERSSNNLLLELGLEKKFVVQYAGNMGLTHDLVSAVKSAEILKKNEQKIHFLFIGTGAKREWLKRQIKQKNLYNMTLINDLPRSVQKIFLNACDIAFIPFVKGMLGVSVPSRLYNILASGKPIIAMVDPGSELALVIKEEKIGWVVKPEIPFELAETLAEASRSNELHDMGLRARFAAESKYKYDRVLSAYKNVITEVTSS